MDLPFRAIMSPHRTAVTAIVEYETTDPARVPWISPSRAPAGLRELRWCQQNQAVLRPYEGQWVAIKGRRLVKHGPSFQAVHEALSAENISHALIVYVRPEVPDVYDIA